MLFVISSSAGFVRGTGLYLTGELLIPDSNLPSLLSRQVVAVISWSLTLGGFALINYLVVAPSATWRRLRRELADLDKSIVDSREQLDWLLNRRVQGLDTEIRGRFLGLTERMEVAKSEPGESYKRLAELLREFAQKEIRPKAQQLWRAKQPKPLLRAAIETLKSNPLPVAGSCLIFLAGYLINEIRLFGFSIGFAVAVLSTLVFALLVFSTRRLFGQENNYVATLIAVPALQTFASSLLLTSILWERGTDYLFVTGLTTAIWTAVSLFVAGWFTRSRSIFEKENSALDKELGLSAERLEWLQIQLDSAEREMAKYLHGILQSRLMAHALEIEKPRNTNEAEPNTSLASLEEIMAAPMNGFRERQTSLSAALGSLSHRWKGFLELEIQTREILDTCAVDPTMQVIQEALGNALRHGGASMVRIQILDSQEKRNISVFDNGRGAAGKPGIGSAVFESVSHGEWSITYSATGTDFTLSLPLNS